MIQKIGRFVMVSRQIDASAIDLDITLLEFAALGVPHARMAKYLYKNDIPLRYYLRIKKDDRVKCSHGDHVIEYRVIWFMYHPKIFLSGVSPDFGQKIFWDKIIQEVDDD